MIFTRETTALKFGRIKISSRFFSCFRFQLLVPILFSSFVFTACDSPAAAEKSRLENEKIEARSRAAIERAKSNIEKFRKGDAQIRLIDKNGKLVTSAQVIIKQISHDFKFGGYLKIDDLAAEKLPAYENRFAKLFNFAVIGTYWDFIENQRGNENWQWFEREVALARKLNLRIEAAPLLWGTNKAGTPKWLPDEKDELLPVINKRVKSTITKYQNAVEDWEIVNEPLAPKSDVFAERIGTDYIATAFAEARQASPTKRLMLNEYGVFGIIKKHNYNRENYFNLLKNLIEKNVSFDVIGIQAHANGEWFAPADVAETLDRYASLGKPIQITEFSSQMFDYENREKPLSISGNYQTGVWNEEKQAAFYREFYTIAFGCPQVEAIVQWGLDDERAWLPGIGLINKNGAVKANYDTLDRLINNEWRTNLQTNLTGEDFRFRGFYGSYEIEIIVNGKTVKTRFNLRKDDQNKWIVRV